MTLLDDFRSAFGCDASATASAPGRVNLIGEHIDYNGGTVLPMAIARSVKVALSPGVTDRVRIISTSFPNMADRPAGDPPKDHWSDYAIGALAEAEARGWLSGPVDLAIESTVPDGAGVSSSAALVTAILRGVIKLNDVRIAPVELARAARRVETDYIGVPCGLMDQMAVALSRPGEALALDTRTDAYRIVPVPADWAFVTLHSGVHRTLSDGRYKARFEECAAASRALGVDYLCGLNVAEVAQIESLASPLNRRARHVVTEHTRVIEAIDAVEADDMARFGELMTESHRSYSADFDASTPEIDALVADAVSLGASGSRLTGGGFGGCVVSLMPQDIAAHWTAQALARHPNAWLV
ncbi:MAG: galactokinase [Pseudomonadota bacterium]